MIFDLCLVLLLDASGSVDADEWRLQAEGTAAALQAPAIVEHITSGPHGRIQVTAIEWSGGTMPILPWQPIGSQSDADAVAQAIGTYVRKQSGSTAVGDALTAASAALAAAPSECLRQVVDISSDGSNNAGADPLTAVAALGALGTLVNAIVIEDEPGVLGFYEATVSGFVLPATWEAYGQAMKWKLELEIAGRRPLYAEAGR